MQVLGVSVDNVTFEESVSKIERFIKSKRAHHIVTINPEYIVRAQSDKNLRKIINKADLRVPDGVGLVKLARLKERVTGVDLIWQLAKLSEDKGYKLALFGGGEAVAAKAAARIKLIHPRCQIVIINALGALQDDQVVKWHDYRLIREIERTKPDIALVALGMGKQDRFIQQLIRTVKIPVSIGAGGAFEMIAGTTPRAPYILRTLGIEWLWRLIIEPKRLGRILNATVVFPIIFLTNKKRLH